MLDGAHEIHHASLFYNIVINVDKLVIRTLLGQVGDDTGYICLGSNP